MSCCLDSVLKFFFKIEASIFSLQSHTIQQTFSWGRKFEIWFCLCWQFVSHFLLYPEESLADSFMKQKPWKTVSSYLGKFSSHFSMGPACPVHTAYHQAVKVEQFLAQMASIVTLKANSITSFLMLINLSEVIGASRSRYVSLSKRSKFLQHFKCHIL